MILAGQISHQSWGWKTRLPEYLGQNCEIRILCIFQFRILIKTRYAILILLRVENVSFGDHYRKGFKILLYFGTLYCVLYF